MPSAPPPLKEETIVVTVYSVVENRNLGVEVLKLLEEVKYCQEAVDTLDEKAGKEVSSIKVKFDILKKPHTARRTGFIKKIPHFWRTAFSNHPELGSLVIGLEDYFHHLTNIEVEENTPSLTLIFKIAFFFKDNPYFENTVLTKEFHRGPFGKLVSFSDPIKWKEGNSLSKANEPTYSKPGSKRKLYEMSFFTWYHDHDYPHSDAMAQIIREDLWNNPLQYFMIPTFTVDQDTDNEDEGEDANIVEVIEVS